MERTLASRGLRFGRGVGSPTGEGVRHREGKEGGGHKTPRLLVEERPAGVGQGAVKETGHPTPTSAKRKSTRREEGCPVLFVLWHTWTVRPKKDSLLLTQRTSFTHRDSRRPVTYHRTQPCPLTTLGNRPVVYGPTGSHESQDDRLILCEAILWSVRKGNEKFRLLQKLLPSSTGFPTVGKVESIHLRT